MKPKNLKPGRPKGAKSVFAARLNATIADNLVRENSELARLLRSACRAALYTTYMVALKEQRDQWKDGSDKAAVENVRQAVYKLRKNPALRIEVSRDMMHHARGAFKNEIQVLRRTKNLAEKEGEVANALRIQGEIDKLSEPVKQHQALAESQKQAKTDLYTLARERGVELSDEDIKRLEDQHKAAHNTAIKVAAKPGTLKPFAGKSTK